MSRKNRNGQRQAKRPLNLKGIQMSMSIPTDAQAKTAPSAPKPGFVQSASEVKMLDAKCSYQFTRLPSTILESDTSYQRPIDMKRVQRIVDNFDRRLVNPLKVSLRDGHYYVFDGAHTLSVLKEVNKFDNFMVDCMLMHGLTYEDEAYLFALQRGESKEVATAARLKALMLSNDESAADFRTRTELTGFKLAGNGHTSSKGCIGCVAKLWKIYEDNPELYSETLSMLMRLWHGEVWSLGANIIGGLAVFLGVYGSEINEARFMKLVGGADLLTLNRLKDSTARNKDFAYAYAILKLYNKIGGKAALSPYALYERKH